MKSDLLKLLLPITTLFLAGCSGFERTIDVPERTLLTSIDEYNTSLNKRSLHIFDPLNIEPRVNQLQLERRADQFTLIADWTTLKGKEYRGVPSTDYAEEVVRRFLVTAPKTNLESRLLAANDLAQFSSDFSFKPLSKLDPYQLDSEQFQFVAEDLISLLNALHQQSPQVKGFQTLVILTDWSVVDENLVNAINRLRQAYRYPEGHLIQSKTPKWMSPKELKGSCIYLIGISNSLSRSLIDQIGDCGFSSAADKIMPPEQMAHFVERVLYKGPKDSDGDGVFDYKDQCPSTALNALVNFNGCEKFADE
ncbi:hypothetical protein [Marinobacterium sp. xm-d-530]|uniref:hypothetical protein n=1 Tax=Marinobacterium sp. xm-d-530 TaxID=2497747 RepID=UPI00156848B5|nr:hypothetical protein [Marinobacterium sp. xm-d-530]NRQ02624.1 hypothetical protein [Marinobacterium sp. xm-d-530]